MRPGFPLLLFAYEGHLGMPRVWASTGLDPEAMGGGP